MMSIYVPEMCPIVSFALKEGYASRAQLLRHAVAQSVPFPTYSVGENRNTSQGANYPSTLPAAWVVSSGQIITPVGTLVYPGTTREGVALNPIGNHTAAVIVFNTRTGAVLQTDSPAGGKNKDGSKLGIHLDRCWQVSAVHPGRRFRYGQLCRHRQRECHVHSS